MLGLAVGLLRMVLEFSYPAPACGEVDRRPAVLKDFHYLYFALALCGLTAIAIVAVSLCTAPIPEEKASGGLMLPAPKGPPPPAPKVPPLSFTPSGYGLACCHADVLITDSQLKSNAFNQKALR